MRPKRTSFNVVTKVFALIGVVFMSDCSESKELSLYSAKIVDLSSVNLPKSSLVGSLDQVKWLTHPRAGVALWDPREERFLVLPLCESKNPDAPLLLSLYPNEIPPTSQRLLDCFPKGHTVICKNSGATNTTIVVSANYRSVGKIEVNSDAQGLEIDYHGDTSYLF
jgi:hypothetical protein